MNSHHSQVDGVHGSDRPNGVKAQFELEEHSIDQLRPLKVVVIGAGLSGVIAGALLPAKVPGIELTIYEKNPEVGGTWYENIYPGVRCDVASHVYQSSFEPNSQWQEEFATGSEILEYWKHIAKKYDVYRYLKFQQRITRLEWDDDNSKWIVDITDLTTSRKYQDEADFVLPAIGRFNDWRMPNIPGMSEFHGPIRHTSGWDKAVEYAGKKVALIGNGASGIQVLPTLQQECAHVHHYARSRTWIARGWAGDVRTWEPQPFSAKQLEEFKDPETYLRYRKGQEDKFWRGFGAAFRNSPRNNFLWKDYTSIMKERLQEKPELIPKMIPEFSPNCRRPTPGPAYLEALCKENVELIQDAIERFTPTGIQTADGTVRDVDVVFCATGANTDQVPPFPIVSRGIDLREAWKPGGNPGWPHTYLGIATPDFPNLLYVFGPQASGLSGTIPNCVENIVTVIAKILRKVAGQGIRTIVPSRAAADDFAEYSEAFFRRTVLTEECKSWYNGGIKGGRVHGLWPGSAAHLIAARKDPRWEDWEYTYCSTNRFAYFGNGWTDIECDSTYDITSYLKVPQEISLEDLHE